MKASPSDLAAALIVCAIALVALARSERPPRAGDTSAGVHTAAARGRGQAPPPLPAAVSQLRRGEPLALNDATVSDLVLLPGIGPKLAQRIVDERTRRGGFARVEELRSVKGVGPAVLARVAPLLRVTAQAPTAPARESR
ncbi:MAG: helix-hairpin-helix domain-containing protein [Polyangiales bacterium]